MDTSIIPTIPLYKPTYPEPLYNVSSSPANTVSPVSEIASAAQSAAAGAARSAPVSSSVGTLVDVEA